MKTALKAQVVAMERAALDGPYGVGFRMQGHAVVKICFG